jgi:hypothetical protein
MSASQVTDSLTSQLSNTNIADSNVQFKPLVHVSVPNIVPTTESNPSKYIYIVYNCEESQCEASFNTFESAREYFLKFSDKFFDENPDEGEQYNNYNDPEKEELDEILEHMMFQIQKVPYFSN